MEGGAPTLATEVRILYDDEALYVGARMSDPMGAAGIRAPLARRDQLLASNGNNGAFNSLTTDKLAIVLDPYHNHLDEIWFEINPSGVRGDQFNGDPSWDPVWEGEARTDATGWTAELRIPYSQLRFSRDSVQTWGLQLWRVVDRLNEQDMWSFRKLDESGGPGFFGHLQGIVVNHRPRQAELLPYVVSKSQFKYATPGDPYNNSRDMKLSAGADIKYNLTSNLTLDATINPDFGQVEVDPAIAQPFGVRDVLRGEAPLLRRQPERVQLRRSQLHVLQQLLRARRAVLAAHRPAAAAQRMGGRSGHVRRCAGRRHHPRRREDHRPHQQRLHHRPARRGDRTRIRALSHRPRSARAHADRRAADQLLHGPGSQGASAGLDDGRRRGDQHRAPAR